DDLHPFNENNMYYGCKGLSNSNKFED
nr:RecName: Full=Toxin b subunit alpha [Androctonus crassicauda]